MPLKQMIRGLITFFILYFVEWVSALDISLLNCSWFAPAESTSLFTGIDDADVEDEYKRLEIEVGNHSSQVCSSAVGVNSAKAKPEDQKTSEQLSDALSKLSLVEDTPMEPVTLDSMKRTRNISNDLQLEST